MYESLVKIDKTATRPIYQQIVSQTIELIRSGILPSGCKLPGTRKLAESFDVHRKTVVGAFDELIMQGWLESEIGKGTFVSARIDQNSPDVVEMIYENNLPQSSNKLITGLPGFNIPRPYQIREKYRLDDGLPDPRLAPIKELFRAYKSGISDKNLFKNFGYADIQGSEYLRSTLVNYLFKTRGMRINKEQILITRGVTQALYLSINGLLKPGDKVAVPELNWTSANLNFDYRGAELVKVKIDHEGFDVDHLEELCQSHDFKMVYLTPHHQYPTTVIMPAHRRVKLLQLSRKHGFYIFEDDYDYDFHFAGNPLMPLASVENGGQVLYAGSFTKSISPVYRVGYFVASVEIITLLSKIRRLVDRQGDPLLENAIAELIELGLIHRQIRKARKIYAERRDFFGQLMKEHLSEIVQYELPEGGMSVWTKFDSGINLKNLAAKALKKDLYFSDGVHLAGKGNFANSTRLGFASSNEQELEIAVKILKSLI